MNIKEKIINALGGLTKEQSAKLVKEENEHFNRYASKQLLKDNSKLTNENYYLRETLRITENELRRVKDHAKKINAEISTPGDVVRLFTALLPFVKYSKGENSSIAYITVLGE